MLLGLCVNAWKVALDPLPSKVGGKVMIGLVSLDRESFLRSLVEERDLSTQPPLVF